MRTYGRTYNADGSWNWVEVQTDANGDSSYVWITTLVQTLLLNPNESPFYGNYGIPAQNSVLTQLYPDLYMAQTQQQFAGYFSALLLSKITAPEPSYSLNLVTQSGVTFQEYVPIPQ